VARYRGESERLGIKVVARPNTKDILHIHDIVLTDDKRRLINAAWGTEARVEGDAVVLHVPGPGVASSILIDDLELDGQAAMSTTFAVPSLLGPKVVFRITLSQRNQTLASIGTTIAGGSETDISIEFLPVFGRVQLCLSVTLAADALTNHYGTCFFRRGVIGKADDAAIDKPWWRRLWQRRRHR
jgi:hypothetical protein